MPQTNLKFELYRLDSTVGLGVDGFLSFFAEGDKFSGSLDLTKPFPYPCQNEILTGKPVSCGNLTVIEFTSAGTPTLKITLLQNPYCRSPVCYTGALSVEKQFYSMIAIKAT